MIIRPEIPDDIAAIDSVNTAAFETRAEADLVNNLRQTCEEFIFLVAEGSTGEIVGHILFTPVNLEPCTPGVKLTGVGPMAVLPHFQKDGIGSLLVKAGIDTCAKAAWTQ